MPSRPFVRIPVLLLVMHLLGTPSCAIRSGGGAEPDGAEAPGAGIAGPDKAGEAAASEAAASASGSPPDDPDGTAHAPPSDADLILLFSARTQGWVSPCG